MSNVSTLTKEMHPSEMTDVELKRAIRTYFEATIESLRSLAVHVREARRRNLSLAEYSTGMPARMIAVADGKLEPEILLKHLDNLSLVDAIRGVPLKTQRSLARGATVRVVEYDRSSGDLTARDKTLRQLTGPQAKQIFVEGVVLSVDEQKKRFRKILAASKKHASPESTSPKRRMKVTADPDAGVIVVGSFRLPARAFFAAFKTLGYSVVKDET